MKKNLFLTIIIALIILGTGLFVFVKQKEMANLEKFYKLTLEDPLCYSPFFDSTEWKNSIKILKDTENQLKEVSMKNYPKAFSGATPAEKEDYILTLKNQELFPYQFLENLILTNAKTNDFLKNPSVKLANELLDSYNSAVNSYIQSITSKIKLLEKNQPYLNTAPFIFFADNITSPKIVFSDFLTIKENGDKLKAEVEKRKNCLLGKNSCPASQNNKKVDTFIDFLSADFDLKGEKIDFIKNTILNEGKEIQGPYKIKSFCWQNPNFEQWLYLVFFERNGFTFVMPKLANQNYYWKILPAPSGNAVNVVNNAILNKGLKFTFQSEATTYECSDLTFYPELLALDFIKKQIKNGEITIENLKKERNYRLLIENQFGLISPVINTVSDQLNILKLYRLIDKGSVSMQNLHFTRSAYSIFYFPFAGSIWRIDRQLQYFVPENEKPLNEAQQFVTLDDLKKLGYTEKEIEKFNINTPDFLNNLLEK